MDDVAVDIAEHLHFDVPRLVDESLDIQRSITERRDGLSSRCRNQFARGIPVADGAHALTATTRRRLDEHGKPELLGGGEDSTI